MRRGVLRFLVSALLLAGCAGRGPMPSVLSVPRDPGPVVASFEQYNAAPAKARLWGTLKAGENGTVGFGATVVDGVGLRFDALAGPFLTPVVVLACRTGDSCVAFLPGRGKAYLDDAGPWEGLLGPVLRGRVPRLEGGLVTGAWDTKSGRTALLLTSGGWQEQIEFSEDGRLPVEVFVSRTGEPPEARIAFGEFGVTSEGHPFPGRVEVWLRESGKTYALRSLRVETGGPEVDPGVFVLPLPPGTGVESLKGQSTWEETGIPIWPPLRAAPTGPP